MERTTPDHQCQSYESRPVVPNLWEIRPRGEFGDFRGEFQFCKAHVVSRILTFDYIWHIRVHCIYK